MERAHISDAPQDVRSTLCGLAIQGGMILVSAPQQATKLGLEVCLTCAASFARSSSRDGKGTE
jgi:hypothetical protein